MNVQIEDVQADPSSYIEVNSQPKLFLEAGHDTNGCIGNVDVVNQEMRGRDIYITYDKPW